MSWRRDRTRHARSARAASLPQVEAQEGRGGARSLLGRAKQLLGTERKRPRAPSKGQASKVIAVAKGQVGYREGKNNYTKYAADLIKAKIAQSWWQNAAWCQTFQSWCFVKAKLKPLAPMTPGCATAVNWFRKKGRFSRYPAIGAQVFYGSGGGTHVGLVYKYDDKTIWTIEGNTNDGGSAEGNGVYLKKRVRKDRFVYGYGYPRFDEGIVTADPSKKGKQGFTYKKTASSGAAVSTSEPAETEAALPWVSWNQVTWAATHSADAERALEAGDANPKNDVGLVQDALKKVMGEAPDDDHGIYGTETAKLFSQFRKEKLKDSGEDATGAPDQRSLVALAEASGTFRARAGSVVDADEEPAATRAKQDEDRDDERAAATTFDRKKFFAGYRRAFGPINQAQTDGLEALLKAMEKDSKVTDVRWFAYMLATVKHECANTWKPIREYGRGAGRPYGVPKRVTDPQGKTYVNKYYGRGYVQLTWDKNYARMGRLLKNRLLYEPDLALKPAIAYKIMSLGMRHGLFTGVKLGDYIRGGTANYEGARKIINGTDRAKLIAGYAKKLEKVLRSSKAREAPRSQLRLSA